jgi:enoyl-CoA hydratase
MEEGKGNAIGAALLLALDAALDELAERAPRAVVLTGSESIFSAGLDLPGLLSLDRSAMRELIGRFSEVMLRLFTVPFPLVAAVNGHAVAGGCVLALQADHRLMTDEPDARIGLKEVALGIGLPSAVIETLRCQVPAASLAPIALEARLLEPREALELGLVDEVVPAGRLLEHARKRAAELGRLPAGAFAQVKSALRAPAVEAIRSHGAAEAERWLDTWFSDDGRRLVGETVARLTAPRG